MDIPLDCAKRRYKAFCVMWWYVWIGEQEKLLKSNFDVFLIVLVMTSLIQLV
jgi:hypothetical protein